MWHNNSCATATRHPYDRRTLMTDPTLTYVIIVVGTLAILALRYYRHVRQERAYFESRKPPASPSPPPPPPE